MRRMVLAAFLAALLSGGVVEGATITRVYTWESLGRTWTLDHAFSRDAYQHFRSLPRISTYTEYGSYVLEPVNDAELSELIDDFQTLAGSANLNMWEKLNLVVAFVQSLRYETEEGEYPRYPMGFGVVLLAFTTEMHMAVGIRVQPPNAVDAASYEWNGERYYYVETTAAGWSIGTMPTCYTSAPEIIALASVTP